MTTITRILTTFSALFQWRSLKTRVTIFTLIFFLVGIWSLAFYASRVLRGDMERVLSEQQFSTVSIMAAHVNQELDIRLQALDKTARLITPAILGNAASMQKFLEERYTLAMLFNNGIYVTRLDGTAIADVPVSAGRIGVNYMDRDYVVEALKGKTTVSKPVMGKKTLAPTVVLSAPIRDIKGHVIGVLAGGINLGIPNFLDKITNSSYGKTGGYLIIAPQHKLTVIGTNKSRIMQPSPSPGINPLFDRYAQGYEGSGVVVDSRGLEVLSSAKQIPAAGWIMVARIPTGEAFAPIRAMMLQVLLAAVFLTLLAGSLTWWMLKRQLAPVFTAIKTLAALSDADHPLQPLPVTRQDEIGELIGGFNRLLETLRQREELLKESEERYQSLFAQAGDGILILNTNGKILSVNQSFADMHGFTAEEILAMGLEGIDVEGVASASDRIRRIVNGEKLSFEVEHYHRDGHVFPIAVTANLVSSGNGQLIIAIHRDLTERKQVEAELGRSREAAERLADEMAIVAEVGRVISSTLNIDDVYERFASITRKLIPFDTLTVDLIDARQYVFRIAYFSGFDFPRRAAGCTASLVGTMSELVMQRNKALIINASSSEEITRLYPDLNNVFSIAAGFHSNMLIPLFSDDAIIGTLHFRAKKANAYSESDLHLAEQIGMQIAGAIVNAQLFNDLSKTEQSLRISEERFRKIFEESPIGIAFLNERREIFLTNHRYRDFLGYSEAEIIERGPAGLLHPDDWAATTELTKSLRAGEVPLFHMEPRYIRKDGAVVWADTRITGLRDEDGRLLHAIAWVQDITDRKRAEEEKQRLEARLQRAEKMEALGTLAGGVAHDLNNVLGIVVGYAEMLLDEIDESNPLRADVMKIMEGGHRSAAIVQDLLTLARRGVQTRKVFNLNTAVMDSRNTPEFEKILSFNPKVQVKTDLGADLLNIVGSPIHLAKTIMNLVSNAVESMPDGGMLTITTSNQSLDKPVHGYDAVNEGDYVVLSVADTGTGISDGDIKHIFEPFYTKKVMGRSGTGLGLAVVWGTVKDHSGYIDVQSEVGEGTTFTLYFPVTREEVAKAELAIPLSAYIGNDESILVIDDIKEQRELAVKMLGKLNYKVKTLASGEEAVEYLRTEKADLIILDMIMDPGMDGLDTYKAIVEIHPKQKAIIVSGFSETERVKEARALGAGDYVRKPYVQEKLGLAVRNELHSK